MATRPVLPVTEVPQDIVAELYLDVGKKYTLQNVGSAPIVVSQRDAATAAATLIADRGHILASAGVAPMPADVPSTGNFDVSGDRLYVWTEAGVSALIVSDA